jgi:hypothetical protein
MKTSQKQTNLTPGRRSYLPWVAVLSLGIAVPGWLATLSAESVDSELVLLVDIVRPELSNSEFNRLMNGYADTFTSSQVLDSIQSGAYGRIAVSMMLYGGASTQVVGIPWMSISNASEAAGFADLVRNVTRPSTFAYSDPGPALAAATASFGTETGGTANGFESAVQIIEVASAGIPSASMAATTAASSANALAAGVDLINALALGNFSASIDSFYSSNVIGSTLPGVTATTNTAGFNGTLSDTIGTLLNGTVETGAITSTSAIPEPGMLVGLLPTVLLLLKRRRN